MKVKIQKILKKIQVKITKTSGIYTRLSRNINLYSYSSYQYIPHVYILTGWILDIHHILHIQNL